VITCKIDIWSTNNDNTQRHRQHTHTKISDQQQRQTPNKHTDNTHAHTPRYQADNTHTTNKQTNLGVRKLTEVITWKQDIWSTHTHITNKHTDNTHARTPRS